MDPLHPDLFSSAAYRQRPVHAVLDATLALEYDGAWIGTALAIAPRIAVTAGHHYSATNDDPGLVTVRPSRGPRTTRVGASFAQKATARDLLIVWLDADVPFVPLRAHQPPALCPIATVYVSPVAPHREVIVSPGVVVESTQRVCRARGVVTSFGASGGPVVDAYGDRVVGLHLSVSPAGPGGVLVTEFISAKEIVRCLCDAAVDPSAPWDS